MCGLAFSGKSTLSREIANRTGGKRIAFDEIWVEQDKQKPIPKNSEGWHFIRKAIQGQISKLLKEGESVVYDDNNIRFEHREEIRNIASQAGIESVVIYLDTPLNIIRSREHANKITGIRHEVEPENFQTVLEQLEPPNPDEKAIVFTPEANLDIFLQQFH